MMLLKRSHEYTEPESSLYRPARRCCRRLSNTPMVLPLPHSHLSLHLQSTKAISIPPPISTIPTVKKQHSVSISITSLPSELLLQIFSYLPFIDTIRSSQTCRKFHSLTHDPSLTSHLDLSVLPLGLCRYGHLPTYLSMQLQTCRSLTLNYNYPSITTLQSTSFVPHIFHETSLSPNLTSLTLRSLPRKLIPTLYQLFSGLKGTRLTHVDLARTYVPNHLLSLIVTKHGHSLVSLHLEFAAITDYALEMLVRSGSNDDGCPVPKLRHLGLAGCLSISKSALRTFLRDSCPLNIDSLDLRWEMDINAYWIDDWLSRKHCYWQQQQQGRASTGDGASSLKARVDLRGCEMVTEIGERFLNRRWSWAPTVEFKFTGISQVQEGQQWKDTKMARWWKELERRVEGSSEGIVL